MNDFYYWVVSRFRYTYTTDYNTEWTSQFEQFGSPYWKQRYIAYCKQQGEGTNLKQHKYELHDHLETTRVGSRRSSRTARAFIFELPNRKLLDPQA